MRTDASERVLGFRGKLRAVLPEEHREPKGVRGPAVPRPDCLVTRGVGGDPHGPAPACTRGFFNLHGVLHFLELQIHFENWEISHKPFVSYDGVPIGYVPVLFDDVACFRYQSCVICRSLSYV